MNPFKWVIDFFKFLWDDTKSDFGAIAKISDRLHQGKPAIEEERLEELKAGLKQITFRDILEANWGMWLMMALALTVGWWWASQYYQVQCNNFVFETFIEPQQSGEWHIVPGGRPGSMFDRIDFPDWNASGIG